MIIIASKEKLEVLKAMLEIGAKEFIMANIDMKENEVAAEWLGAAILAIDDMEVEERRLPFN